VDCRLAWCVNHVGEAVFDLQPLRPGALITMRPLQQDDYAALCAIGSDPEVWALHPQPERATAAGFRAYFDDQLASGGALTAINRADGARAVRS
jgi:hypothetical protein